MFSLQKYFWKSMGERHSTQNVLNTIPNETLPSQPASNIEKKNTRHTHKNSESKNVKGSGYTTNNNTRLC